MQGEYLLEKYSPEEYSHLLFIEATVGSTRKGTAYKGSASTHYFMDLQQGVHAREVFVREVLARGILHHHILDVGSTCKEVRAREVLHRRSRRDTPSSL